jgi:hypothetical protein
MSKKDVPKNQRKSYHRGASDERTSFMAFFRRFEVTGCAECRVFLDKAFKFGKKRVKRFKRVGGGL